ASRCWRRRRRYGRALRRKSRKCSRRRGSSIAAARAMEAALSRRKNRAASSIAPCRPVDRHSHLRSDQDGGGPRGIPFSRPLRSRFEGWLDGEHLECQQEKEAQNHPQPGEDEPKIVADGTQDDVGGIAGATSEIAAAEMTLCLHM